MSSAIWPSFCCSALSSVPSTAPNDSTQSNSSNWESTNRSAKASNWDGGELPFLPCCSRDAAAALGLRAAIAVRRLLLAWSWCELWSARNLWAVACTNAARTRLTALQEE
eukprot:121335-Pelagomonas_calceolata.AAC.2